MSNSMVHVYPDGIELKTEARKLLFSELLAIRSFGEKPKGFNKALKQLVFEGDVQSYDRVVLNHKAPSGKSVNPLGAYAPVYICLGSPVVSVEFYRSVLERYELGYMEMILVDVAVYVDMNPNYSSVFERLHCLVHSIVALGHGMGEQGAVSFLCRTFNNLLSGISYDASCNGSLFVDFLSDYSSRFSEIIEVDDRFLETTKSLMGSLLGSDAKHPDAYSAAWFVEFCKVYFSRGFSTEFLQFLDEIYESIPADKRIRLNGNEILYSPA